MLALYCYSCVMLLLFNTKQCSLNRHYSHLPLFCPFLPTHTSPNTTSCQDKFFGWMSHNFLSSILQHIPLYWIKDFSIIRVVPMGLYPITQYQNLPAPGHNDPSPSCSLQIRYKEGNCTGEKGSPLFIIFIFGDVTRNT
jgi:hypothetical protein